MEGAEGSKFSRIHICLPPKEERAPPVFLSAKGGYATKPLKTCQYADALLCWRGLKDSFHLLPKNSVCNFTAFGVQHSACLGQSDNYSDFSLTEHIKALKKKQCLVQFLEKMPKKSKNAQKMHTKRRCGAHLQSDMVALPSLHTLIFHFATTFCVKLAKTV